MKVQFNTDKNIAGNHRLEAFISSSLAEDLARFSHHITRIEVHLSDENGQKAGQNDKRCLLEARLENRQPIAVTDYGNTIEEAFSGATDKLKAALGNILDRLKEH
ncbi:MAG: HPF/RaiA family ribosome-associated protein [Bacteroidia bacterium]